MKIMADMRSVTSSCPGLEYNSSHCITTVAMMSSNYITVHALLETADRCRTTSSIEFHQTLSFPSSVGKGFGYARLACYCLTKPLFLYVTAIPDSVAFQAVSIVLPRLSSLSG